MVTNKGDKQSSKPKVKLCKYLTLLILIVKAANKGNKQNIAFFNPISAVKGTQWGLRQKNHKIRNNPYQNSQPP